MPPLSGPAWGPSAADAIRLTLTRVARDGILPFTADVANAVPREAMREAHTAVPPSFGSAAEMPAAPTA